ncbi:hypothetical protein [Hallerella succinigenes]|uniref:Uncharacterized protein n=1 Tax=Hallerella succinigenes TaxID=1896222 RepID=A0A2M9A9K3_9BACT|nr:hypothetical protein [Hallerella succinigenes]PJJ42402.1 hypothetical protein BGX16_2428 [Hallerella succinigenes]
MLEFAIAIAMAVVVAGLGLIVAAFVGQAILDGIDDVCKDKDNEEDSRIANKHRDTDHDPFLT